MRAIMQRRRRVQRVVEESRAIDRLRAADSRETRVIRECDRMKTRQSELRSDCHRQNENLQRTLRAL